MTLQTKILHFIKSEAVLTVATVLALLSALWVHPDSTYIDYIDLRTLAILFGLMTVMASLRGQGVFDRLGRALLGHTHSLLQVVLALAGLCFFGGMLITNDVALITFVPFAFVVLGLLGEQQREALCLPVVCIQTVAANLGSMLTPIGNPQNLYLYGKSGLSLPGFVGLMLPYSLVSLALVAGWCVLCCRGQSGRLAQGWELTDTSADKPFLIPLNLALFLLCLLVVVHLVPYPVMLAAVLGAALLFDRPALQRVDYSLLATFVAFFIFIGNLGRLPAFSGWLGSILAGREVPVAILASQVTSNVPAALLLSGFTDKIPALIIGTNLGGLGTLIASMASLISYRQIARFEPERKGAYFRLFTLSNLIFLAVLFGTWLLIAR